MKILIPLLSLIFSMNIMGAELKGKTLPDEIKIQDQKLILNGLGLREVSYLGIHIKVYVGGLYLPKKTSNESDVLSNKGYKVVRQTYFRRVRPKDAEKTWKENLEKACAEKCDVVRERQKELFALLPTTSENDIVDYQFTDKGVALIHNEKNLGEVASPELAKAMLGVFVGPKPASSSLKEGLLGISSDKK